MNVKSKSIYLFSWLLPRTEKNLAYAFMGKHGLTSYPNEYMLDYKNRKIEVMTDLSLNLFYVIHSGKKLYFPKSYTDKQVAKIYKSLITEQDSRSAHRYVRSYDELKGKTLFDIGSAEGIFSLDTIEFTNHVYLFECDSSWLPALEATFAPWKEKVTLVKKYVSDHSDETNISVDDFLKDKSKDNLFLKMDIEGAEQSALRGAKHTLQTGKNISVAVCTYHRLEDPEQISNYLSSLGYTYEFTNGYMYWGRKLNKGVIRGHN